MGTKNAREEIWKFVGPETMVIGHSVQNDLNALRWIHNRVVDTVVLEEEVYRGEDEKRAIAEEIRKNLEDAVDSLALSKTRDTDSEPMAEERLARDNEQICQNDQPVQEKEGQKKKKAKGTGRVSLKTASMVRLGRAIQTGGQGHDSVEDALASRDLAEWHAYNTGTNILWRAQLSQKPKKRRRRASKPRERSLQ